MSSEVQAKWMNSLIAFQLVVAGDFFLEKVFNRLDVMVCGALDILDALGIFFIELVNNAIEYCVGMVAECCHFGYRVVRPGPEASEPQPVHGA